VRARGELTSPMLVTESGIVTLVRLVHVEKALCESQTRYVRETECMCLPGVHNWPPICGATSPPRALHGVCQMCAYVKLGMRAPTLPIDVTEFPSITLVSALQ
jgi:hypothetical protein